MVELDTGSMYAIAGALRIAGGEIADAATDAGDDIATAGEGNSGFKTAATLPGLGQVWTGSVNSLGSAVRGMGDDVSNAADAYINTDGDNSRKIAAADDPGCRDMQQTDQKDQCSPPPPGSPGAGF